MRPCRSFAGRCRPLRSRSQGWNSPIRGIDYERRSPGGHDFGSTVEPEFVVSSFQVGIGIAGSLPDIGDVGHLFGINDAGRTLFGIARLGIRDGHFPVIAVVADGADELLNGHGFGFEDAGEIGDEPILTGDGAGLRIHIVLVVVHEHNTVGVGGDHLQLVGRGGDGHVDVEVKVACVQIVKNAQATPAMNVKSSKMDTVQMQYFSGSLIDPQVQMLLKPYVAERLG